MNKNSNDLFVPTLLTTKAPQSLLQICKNYVKTEKNFKVNDDDIQKLIEYGILRASDVERVIVYKFAFNSLENEPRYVKMRFVLPKKHKTTQLSAQTLIFAQHISNNVDDIFDYWIEKKKVYHCYSNRKYWRNLLLRLEGSFYWYRLFLKIYLDNFHSLEPHSIYNISCVHTFNNYKRGMRFMTIDITPEWHQFLLLNQWEDFVKLCFARKCDFVYDLTRCGDVEANPGPVMSKCMRYTNSSMHSKHQAQGMVDEVKSLNDFLHSKLPAVVDSIKSIVNESMISANNTALFADERIKEDIELLSSKVDNHITQIQSMQSKILKTLVVISLISIMVKMRWYKTALFVSGLSLLSLFGIPEQLIEKIQKIFNIEHQAQVFSSGPAISSLVGSIICFFIIGKLPKDSSIENFSKKTNNISRGLSGMINLHKDIGKLWKGVKDFVMSQIDPTPEGFTTMEEEMLQWMKDIEYYVDIVVKKKSSIVAEQVIKMSGLLKQGLKLRRWAFENKCSADVVRNISNYIRTAEQLYNYADKNNTLAGGQRQRPLCIVLFGESQIGKSGAIYLLAQDLCYAAGYRKASDIDEQIYARQPETEFWDGYKGQFVVVRDDALAAVDDVSNPNPELHETIREINDFPFHLHMAALEDKNTYYSSKVGIMTINDINSPIKSLTYSEAFYNRISDNMFRVSPSKQFSKTLDLGGGNFKTILDLEKVEAHLDKLSQEKGYRVPITTDIYQFEKWKKVMIDGKVQFMPDVSVQIMNYEQFSSYMCKQLLKKTDDFKVKKEFMEKRLLSMQAQGGTDDDDIFFDANQDICDIISKRVCNGESMLDIECDLLSSDLANDYLAFKQGSNKMQSRFSVKLKGYSERLYDEAVSSIKNWFNIFKNKVCEILNKYPALKWIFSIGSIAVAMYTAYSLFNQKEETPDHFIINDKIDDATYEKNMKWMSKQSLSFEDKMMYLKTNLMMRYPEEKERIDQNTQGISFVAEGHNSPGSGQMKKNPKHNIEGIQSPGSGKQNKTQKHRVEVVSHESEGTSDTNAMETAFTIMKNNLYSLSYTNSDGKDIVLGNAIALQGFNYLIPYHFIKYLILRQSPLTTKLHLSRINYSEKIYNNMMSFELSELINKDKTLNRAIQLKYGEHELDAVIFCVSQNSNVHLHRSIVNHFILKEELGRLHGNMQGLLLSYHNDNGQIAKVIKSLNDVHNYEQELSISVENETYIHRAGYLYQGDTMKGDCGGPLILKANSLVRKIIGIHISGTTGEGYSAKLYQELLQEHIDLLSKKLTDSHRAQCYLHIDANILESEKCEVPNGVFNDIGTLKIPLHQCSKTVLKPSLIHGMISKPITKPAHLKPFEKDGQIIDPASKGLEKCGGVTPLIDSKLCDMARNYVKQKLYINHKKIDIENYARVLTYEEAIKGTDDTYMSAICRSTSPGYPFNSDPKYKTTKPGKQEWLGSGTEFDFTSPSAMKLKQLVDELEDNCKKGIITGVICADTMKDERRPINKVDEGKTRMFSACPMHFVTLFRKYYLGFASYLMHNRNLNGIAVGTNPYSDDWDQIVRQITKKGKKVLAGDFSNYDGSLNVQVLWLVYEIIEEFYKRHDKNYKEEDARVRYSLWCHIVNSVHVNGKYLYQWTHSQPSGNPFTVIINSVYNLLILVIAYLLSILLSDLPEDIKAKLFNTMSFDKNVSPIVYGDDNILNISDFISSIFNQKILTDMLKILGHDYTEETKDGKMHLYREIHEINFLKRKFVFDDDTYHWIAPLDQSVIYEMLNWVRGNSVDSVFLLKTNIETALREMSLHGFHAYQTFVRELENNEIVMRKVQPFIPTYSEVRSVMEHLDPMGGFSA